MSFYDYRASQEIAQRDEPFYARRIEPHLVEVDRGFETPCKEWDQARNRHGYGCVWSRGKMHLVHRVVWTIFEGDPGKAEVRHRCDNPPCAELTHLIWGTHAENMADMAQRKRGMRGESHLSAKITREIADEIRIVENRSLREISQIYGLSITAVWSIRAGRTWK